MHLGQITLYKKISKGRSYLGSQDSKNYFTALGNFQHMKYSEYSDIDDFSKIVEYPAGETVEGVRYALYPMFFYDAFNQGEVPFTVESLIKEKFFAVGTLKLNKSRTLTNLYENATSMLNDVKTEVDICIESYDKWHDKDEPVLKLYPMLGSYDLLAIAYSSSMHDLTQILPLLRELQIPSDSGKAIGESLFRQSSSFLAIHNTFQLDRLIPTDSAELSNLQQSVISATVNYSLNDVKNHKHLPEFFKSFLDIPQIHYYLYGSYDIALNIDNCPLDKLLFLLGVRSEILQKLSEGDTHYDEYIKCANYYDNYAETHIGASHVLLICRGQLGKEDEKLKLEELKNWGEYSISVPDNENSKKPADEFEGYIRKIRLLRLSVYDKLSVSAKRTLDFLVDKCIVILSSNFRYVAGRRAFSLISCALQTIKDNPGEFSGEHITFCLDNISSMVTTILMADNLRIDQFGGGDVETINPCTKVYYAIENITRKLYDATSDNSQGTRVPPIFYVTINHHPILGAFRRKCRRKIS